MFRNFSMKLHFISKRFAGHSKWANIRHIKGAKDAERNSLFTKLSRQIKVAVTEGGNVDPKKNPKLMQILDQCKRFDMPLATMQSVLKSCENDKSNAKSYTVDIKGPGSSMIICELFTSNLHHTRQVIATQLKKTNSKFTDGTGLHLFEEKGMIQAENPTISSKPQEEQLELATDHAIESNAEEVTMIEGEIFQFICSKTSFAATQNSLEKLGYKIVDASIDYTPLNWQSLSDSDLKVYEKLMKKLDEIPEVVRLFDNVSSSSS